MTHKNIAPNTYVWVREDPSKHFLALDELKEPVLVELEVRGWAS